MQVVEQCFCNCLLHYLSHHNRYLGSISVPPSNFNMLLWKFGRIVTFRVRFLEEFLMMLQERQMVLAGRTDGVGSQSKGECCTASCLSENQSLQLHTILPIGEIGFYHCLTNLPVHARGLLSKFSNVICGPCASDK